MSGQLISRVFSKLALLGGLLLFSLTSFAAITQWTDSYKAYNGNTEVCTLDLHLQLDSQQNTTHKPLFWLSGNGWQRVDALADMDSGTAGIQNELIEELIARGYAIFSIEYRGVRGSGTSECPGTVTLDQQIDDVKRGFSKARVIAGWTWLNIDTTNGWVIAGGSAGGFLSAALSRKAGQTDKAAIRSVFVQNGPVSFHTAWSRGSNSMTSQAEDLELPGPNSTIVDIPLAFSGAAIGIINEVFNLSNANLPACSLSYNFSQQLWSASNTKGCMTSYHDGPFGGFVSQNTFADTDGAPFFLATNAKDYIVPTQTLYSVCEWQGGATFVSLEGNPQNETENATYIADCGTEDTRLAIYTGNMPGGTPGDPHLNMLPRIWDDFEAWDNNL